MGVKNIIKQIIGINNIKFIKSWFPNAKKKFLLEQRRIFYSQFLKGGSLFFDIGANYGNRIEPLIGQGINIIAVEPQEECVNFLRKKYGNKIVVLQNGLGEKVESKTMHISTNANILSSFSKEWIDSTKQSGRFKKIKWNEKREIQMTTLDKLIKDHGMPDFIKIDVEGFELQVLKGLTAPVNALSIEYTVSERKNELLECLSYLNILYKTNVKFNYCISENTEFSLFNWVNYDEIIIIINSEVFLKTQVGDIYARLE